MPFVAKPLVPKNPNGPLRVIVIGRVSTEHQPIENIDASYRYVGDFLATIYKGPLHPLHLGERASGMRTDRESIQRAEAEIATGTWDLVIAEDLSRFYRNPRHQYGFVQDAVDMNTRVICIGDNLDTADENWEVTLGAAALRHGLLIPDTRRRVRRTATDAFHKGGMVQKVRFGFRKLSVEEAKSGEFGPKGLRIAKVPECTHAIRHLRQMILDGKMYVELVDWLRANDIRPGKYVTSNEWSINLVIDLLRDPILHGERTFRDVEHQPIFGTGKHRRLKNPAGPEREIYPELAHFTLDEHQELLDAMNRRMGLKGEALDNQPSPLRDRPRSRTYFPGQHMRCGICGGLYYWGEGHLKCKNAFRRIANHCWNHVVVCPERAQQAVVRWMLSQLGTFPHFQAEMLGSAWEEYVATMKQQNECGKDLGDQILRLEKEAKRLAKAIRLTDEMDALVKDLKEVQEALNKARRQQELETARSEQGLALCSQEEFAATVNEGLLSLAKSSFDFADFMRRTIPEFVILPVQALDTGLVRPRARIKLRIPDSPSSDYYQEVTAVLDLFEYPVYLQCLSNCLAEREKNPAITQIAIATKLGVPYVTVKRAFAYHCLMQREGLTNLYRELRTEPKKASRWRSRSDHPRDLPSGD